MQRTYPVKRKKRAKLKTLKKLKEELWSLCRDIIRALYKLPDGTYRCYTCDSIILEPIGAHTGHFLASSTCGVFLRYDLRNLRIQDYKCNIHLGGNGAEFYPRLVKEKGQEYVDQLFRDKYKITKGDRFFFEEKISEYQKILEELKNLSTSTS